MNATTALRLSIGIAVALVLSVVAGCGSDGEAPLDVFAASSLTNVFGEIADAWETENPGSDVRINFAGSSTLREQLRDGAEAEVFVSANQAIVDSLVSDGTLRGAPTVMASNELVIAVPRENPGDVRALGDLADEALLVGVCATGVPCGELAQELVDSTGIAIAVDTEEPDVRSLARRLADGELDAALIYATDAAADEASIAVIETDLVMPSTSYPIAAVTSDDETAQSFIDFVLSDAGQAILLSWGFGPA